MNGAVASARTAVERVVNNKIQRGELSPMILLPPSSISINAENFSNGIGNLTNSNFIILCLRIYKLYFTIQYDRNKCYSKSRFSCDQIK